MKDIKSLKKELLAAENNEIVRSHLMSEIENLKIQAESEIRRAENEITYATKELTVEQICQRYENGLVDETNELYIPDYQRSYKWDEKTLSRFIESILLNFPIPYIYVASIRSDELELDGRMEIIDGSQRIRALFYFTNNEIELCELKQLKVLEGFRYKDLPVGRQRRFLRSALRFIELNGNVEESERRDLFERINSGVKPLLPSEQRHGSDAAHSDFYQKVIIGCSENSIFKDLTPLSDKKRESGDHRELVTRFFAYTYDIDSYNGSPSKFLDEYLIKSKDMEAEEIEIKINFFNQTMEFIKNNLPIGFRKTDTSKSTPRARFEAIAVGVAEALKCDSTLKSPITPFTNWIFDDEFKKIVSADSANNTSQLRGRINFVKEKVLGIG